MQQPADPELVGLAREGDVWVGLLFARLQPREQLTRAFGDPARRLLRGVASQSAVSFVPSPWTLLASEMRDERLLRAYLPFSVVARTFDQRFIPLGRIFWRGPGWGPANAFW